MLSQQCWQHECCWQIWATTNSGCKRFWWCWWHKVGAFACSIEIVLASLTLLRDAGCWSQKLTSQMCHQYIWMPPIKRGRNFLKLCWKVTIDSFQRASEFHQLTVPILRYSRTSVTSLAMDQLNRSGPINLFKSRFGNLNSHSSKLAGLKRYSEIL